MPLPLALSTPRSSWILARVFTLEVDLFFTAALFRSFSVTTVVFPSCRRFVFVFVFFLFFLFFLFFFTAL